MERIMKRVISSCHECVFIETIDYFSTHQYFCKFNGYQSVEIGDGESQEKAESQLKKWFKTCNLWLEVKGE